MAHKTEALFRDDAYLGTADATVVAVNDRGGIILDRTVFYATSGGQPGDTGSLERTDAPALRLPLRSPAKPRTRSSMCRRRSRRFHGWASG